MFDLFHNGSVWLLGEALFIALITRHVVKYTEKYLNTNTNTFQKIKYKYKYKYSQMQMYLNTNTNTFKSISNTNTNTFIYSRRIYYLV